MIHFRKSEALLNIGLEEKQDAVLSGRKVLKKQFYDLYNYTFLANNASTHVIVFPATASHSEKLAIIGQTILIDYTFYQQKNDDSGS